MSIEQILKTAPVIPVLVIDKIEDAVPLAHALVKGGLRVLEITLRTDQALACMRAIKAEVKHAIVGAGTVLTGQQYELIEDAGCAFAVSPGSTADLIAAARDSRVPLLPGAATASEVMALVDEGFTFQKFFPAEPAGGAAYLSSLASPLPMVKFCPTGGINFELARKYRKLSNVICVGGSWMAPKGLIEAKDWEGVERLAREAAGL